MSAKRATKTAAKKAAKPQPPESAVENPPEPIVQPTEPIVQPTEPTEPTEPIVQPTEPTEPIVQPTEPIVQPDPPADADTIGRLLTDRAKAFVAVLLSQYFGRDLKGVDMPAVLTSLSLDHQVVVTKNHAIETHETPLFEQYNRKVDVNGGNVSINVGRALVHAKHY